MVAFTTAQAAEPNARDWLPAPAGMHIGVGHYVHFTAEEVARVRRELTRALQAIGLEPAPYTYGSTNHPH